MGTIEKALNKRKETVLQSRASHTDSARIRPEPMIDEHHRHVYEKDDSISRAHISALEERTSTPDDVVSSHVTGSSYAFDDDQYSQKVEVDIGRLKNMGFITSLESNTLLNEEFREIKRPLLRNIKGRSAHPIERANLIQVTSSLQGEGKTFTSVNLAMAIAMELDYTVLLVDADVIKSSVSKTLGINAERGLTDYLQGDVNKLSDVLLHTNIPKLSVLPAGRRHDLSTELLNSEFMDNLIHELAFRYKDRVVIIDSPPLLQTNESRVLAHKVGQIVFVVEQNKTTQTTIKNALSLLDPEMVIGLVMNKNRSGSKSNYYYYGYGSDADTK